MLRKANWDKTLQNSLKFSDSCKSIPEKEFGQIVEKPSDLILCLVSWKQRNLEIRMNIRSAFKMFWQRVASLVKFYTNQKKIFAERGKA